MAKKKYLIDGRFLASMSTGVDRFAYQILSEFDKLYDRNASDYEVSILVPANAKEVPAYKNIRVIKSKRNRFWTQIVYGGYARFHRMIPINLCNEASVIAPKGITALHDVCYAETKDVFPYVEEFPASEREWFLKIYKRICKKAYRVITVSEFSKERIEKLLGMDGDRITVIGNGWQHFKHIEIDETLVPEQDRGKYFFVMTSANKNKNFPWVLKVAKNNPDCTFIAAGKDLDKIDDLSKYPNVKYVGYATDVMAKTYMKYCKAFLFPSYYEGFGIPPMEAMSVGAKIIISDRASLPEIFGGTAYYISPENADVNLNELIKIKTDDYSEVLEKYSWKHSAEKLLELL